MSLRKHLYITKTGSRFNNKFYNDLKNYTCNKNDVNRIRLSDSRAEYKKLLKKTKYESRRNVTKKLVDARLTNAKQYWKMLKDSLVKVSSSNVSADNFASYFKAINNPENHFYQADEDILYFNDRYLDGELQVMFAELDIEITLEEIDKSINNYKKILVVA